MSIKESMATIFSLIFILVTTKAIVSATQFKESKLQYTWVINNFRQVTSQNPKVFISSPVFSPPDNKTFSWYLRLYPYANFDANASHMGLYLTHDADDTVRVNYILSMNHVSMESNDTFKANEAWGRTQFITRDAAFKSILANGSAIIKVEIRYQSNIIDVSGANDQCTSMEHQALKNKMSDDFLTLLEDETFSDITIKSGEHEIRVHKIILAARSPVLASLIAKTNSTLDNNGNSSFIEINDIKPKVLRKLLQYIYTDKLDNVDFDMAKDLLVASVKYNLNGLKEKCDKILCYGMNVDNAIEILEIADYFYIRELKLQASKFIAKHAFDVISTPEFKELELKKPHPMYDVFRMMAYKLELREV